MFLKGFKKKSAKKYIVKQLQKPRNLNNDKIKTIGILVDATDYERFPFVSEIAETFKLPSQNIQVLYYQPDKKKAKLATENVYTKSDLAFKGNLKNKGAVAFLETPFDCLINFYANDKLMLNLVAVKSKAKFKIGFSSSNENINDFSVATKMNNIKEFTSELKKYLTILNKI